MSKMSEMSMLIQERLERGEEPVDIAYALEIPMSWIHEEQVEMVQDRKTGEWYNPQERFDEIMNKPEIMASLKRLAVR